MLELVTKGAYVALIHHERRPAPEDRNMVASNGQAFPVAMLGLICVEYVRVSLSDVENPAWQRDVACIADIRAGSMERHDCLDLESCGCDFVKQAAVSSPVIDSRSMSLYDTPP